MERFTPLSKSRRSSSSRRPSELKKGTLSSPRSRLTTPESVKLRMSSFKEYKREEKDSK